MASFFQFFTFVAKSKTHDFWIKILIWWFLPIWSFWLIFVEKHRKRKGKEKKRKGKERKGKEKKRKGKKNRKGKKQERKRAGKQKKRKAKQSKPACPQYYTQYKTMFWPKNLYLRDLFWGVTTHYPTLKWCKHGLEQQRSQNPDGIWKASMSPPGLRI